MRLQRVRVFGFKTFADRAEFQLGGGVVAVVGPNGCGKSNLVDAILWGLGEGSVRHLRAAQAQDVIFGGSSKRKPIGFAEVQLTFDNSDGGLPIDATEVEVTRRLDRASDSTYRINRHPCRLKDVHDLLADSGLGRAGYAIVGQKEIDQALSATPEQRRDWLDEAAGVQRYRLRKNDALRRLASARTHLERVDDILRELDSQRAPLEEEAELAKRYRELQGALQKVELGLLCRELRESQVEIKLLETKIANAAAMARQESDRGESLELEAKALGERISAVEREMDTVRGLQQAAFTAFERADAELKLVEERLRGLDELERSLGIDDDAETRANAERELASAQSALDEDRGLLELLESSWNESSEALAAAKLRLAACDAALAEGRAAQREQLRRQLANAQARERSQAIQREMAGIERALPGLQQAFTDAEAAAQSIEGEKNAARDGLESAHEQRARIQTELDALQHRRRGLLAELAALEGRKRGIQSTIESHEGMHHGPRAVLEAVRNGILSGRFQPVANAVSVPAELSQAIEVALGQAAGDLIVDSDRESKAAIDYLKRERLGRATFHPINLMRPVEASSELRKLLVRPGVLGLASNLIAFDDVDRPVIESLLGRIIVAETLDVALSMARTSGWQRIVTLSGEVVANSGAVTGGVQARQGLGLVQRRSALERLQQDEAVLVRSVDALEESIAAKEAESERIATSSAAASESIRELDSRYREAKQLADVLAAELKEAVRERDRLQRESAGIGTAGDVENHEVDLATLEFARDAAQGELAAVAARADASDVRLAELRQRVASSTARFEAANRTLQASLGAANSRNKRLAELEPNRERQFAIRLRASDARSQAELDRSEADSRLAALQSLRAELLEQNMRLAESAKEASRNVAAIADAAHQAEIARARNESKRANALQRLLEDYSIDEGQAEALDEIPVPADAAAVVSRLRKELRSMGDVNLGAIEAFERLTTRFNELDAQRADILGGIEHIKGSIRELDQLTRDKFTQTFEAVNQAFVELFQRLFGGGEGRLALSDKDNLLESGIDVVVTLPGKKSQPLNLLSGGERSLCATAFLFALLKVKPTPLVVLDEVDAPLDGRNVERFSDLLADFARELQFIVITHNPTTIARADTWLGVTMQEPGVSTLAPVRAPTPQPQRELAAV